MCFLPIPAPDPVPDATGADAPEEGPPTVKRSLTAVGLVGGAGVSRLPLRSVILVYALSLTLFLFLTFPIFIVIQLHLIFYIPLFVFPFCILLLLFFFSLCILLLLTL